MLNMKSDQRINIRFFIKLKKGDLKDLPIVSMLQFKFPANLKFVREL